MTGVEVREHDAKLSACFQAIRKNWPSENVIVCHRLENFYWGFRQFQYHLPEYENVLLVADTSLPGTLGAKKWIGYERRTTFQTEVPIPDGQNVLLVVPPGQSLDVFKSCFDVRKAVLVIECGAKLYQLHP
jgi:ribosomal protein S18 acetylase RimI-like enzyme